MSEPDISKLRKEMQLPANAVFHGWLIHNPERDDFLHSFNEGRLTTETTWTQTPDGAFDFKEFILARHIFERLQLKGKAVIVASFDLDQQIIIASPQTEASQNANDSDNPFRKHEQEIGKLRLH